MLAKRIIPCLDVKDGRVVKGVNFVNFKDAGDPVELAEYYNKQGADELSFLDITASYENRKIIIEIIKKVSKKLFIPLSVGGGITSVSDIQELLSAGAEKVSIGTSTVTNPELVREAAKKFGSQCIVISIDAKKYGDSWKVFVEGGRKKTDIDAIKFAKKMESLGAGEILLNSIDADGTKKGFNIKLTKKVSESVNIPVIASGGAGKLEDFSQIFNDGKADAALAASIFHYGKYVINDVKEYLKTKNIEVRR